MKRKLLFGIVVCTAIVVNLNAQVEICVGGNMEDETKWNVTSAGSAEDPGFTVTFNYTDDIPADGSGGCVRIKSTGGHAYIWQEVTVTAGHRYLFDCAFKDAGGLPAEGGGFWGQFYLDTITPAVGTDPWSEARAICQINAWQGNHSFIDVLFSDYEDLGLLSEAENNDTTYISKDGLIVVPKFDGTYKLGFKMGMCCNDAMTGFEILVDNMSLIDLDSEGTTSVTAILENDTFEVFPNPAYNTLHVKGAVGVVSILDRNGKVLINSSDSEINISSLPAGLYLARYNNQFKKVLVK